MPSAKVPQRPWPAAACNLSPISLNLNSGAGGGDDRALPEAECEEEPDEDWCAQRGLLDPDTCSEVAKHCNETKMAAKTVQVGASDVFLLSTINLWARSLQGRACSDVEFF